MKNWQKLIKLAKIGIFSKKFENFEIYCQFSNFDLNFFLKKIIFYFCNCTYLALILRLSSFTASEWSYLIDKLNIFENFGQNKPKNRQ